MKERIYESTTIFDESLEKVFSFFSKAENLQKLTPQWLNFEILTPAPIVMKEGALIQYQLKLYGLPVKWETEITEWKPQSRFVDTQLKGPYKQWIHTHTFEKREDNVIMVDSVKYKNPGWIFEPLIEHFFVKWNIRKIFNYRRKALSSIFTIKND